MNGIHDIGGMDGFGSIPITKSQLVFEEPWEGRCLGLVLAMGAWGKWSVDGMRHTIERLDPAVYLTSSYYERWLQMLVELCLANGLVTAEEIRTGLPAPDTPQRTPPVDAAAVRRFMKKGFFSTRQVDCPPRFAVGDRVRAMADSPTGHTRLPRYVRGRTGEVIHHHGAHVLPDARAHGKGETPQHLYSVRFTARALWGRQGRSRDVVTVDLWESYLEA